MLQRKPQPKILRKLRILISSKSLNMPNPRKCPYWHVAYSAVLSVPALVLADVTPETPELNNRDKSGQYPASLVVKTRTATTYPIDLTVFTAILNHFDFDRGRTPGREGMHALPAGMHHRRTTLSAFWEYGVLDNFQIGAALPVVFRDFQDWSSDAHDTPKGMGDMLLYGKWRLMRETVSQPAIAADVWFKLPTGGEKRGLGNGENDFTVTAEISKRYDRLSFHLNPGYTFTGGDRSVLGEAADDRLTVNMGVIYHYTSSMLPMVELNGLWWGDLGHQVDLGGGVLFFLKKDVSLKLGIAVPLDVDMPWSSEVVPWVKLATWY